MKIYDFENRKSYDVMFKKMSGEEAMVCPICNATRKHKGAKSFSWNHNKKTGFCHNCQISFVIENEVEVKEYKKPIWKNKTELSENVVKYFESRVISQKTLLDWKITEGLEWMPQTNKEENTIQFNYFRDSELINVKYRTGNKLFKLHKDSELIFYGMDNLTDSKELIIVEGEIDALTFYEAGFKSILSVPNGANSKNNNISYLDKCFTIFEKYEAVIIATDNDIPGTTLRNDLAARIGIEKCFKVNFKDCKDANEYAVKYGVNMLQLVIELKESFPIDGVFTVESVNDELDLLYKFGLKKGLTLNDADIDEYISFETGRLYTITGIPGHGKSEFLDYIVTKLNIIHGYKTAVFSPENHPLQLHISKLISKITGKSFDCNHLEYSDYLQCKKYVNENFFFINPEDSFNFETILTKTRQLVLQKGIKILIIDPYNKIEHAIPQGMSETNYISLFLDRITSFAKRNNIIVFLVAHPRKMQKNGVVHDVPTLYDINGSANFFNKTDFGVTVYRNFQTQQVEIYIQKVKFKHLGEIGLICKMYNYVNGRYEPLNKGINEWDYSNFLTDNKPPIENYEIEPNMNFDNNETPF